MIESPLESLVIDGTTRIVLLVLDGVGDLPDAAHGGRTPLEAARTPHLDALAPRAALGRLIPVAPGITPGSGPGHLALFGYDPITTRVGRGVLEALGLGVELRPGDVAARANFCTVDGAGIVIDRRAGRITGEASARLVEKLARDLPRVDDVEVLLRAGKGHRFVVVLRGAGLSGDVSDADPHREGSPIPPARPLGAEADPAAARTARVVNAFVTRAAERLRGEPAANAVLLRGLSA
ncbi:MAG: 2,3-bisphosphoglycerate-independent phosphoglycerate mutase, partial [Candidatus Eiseniibacteriota bacterium]